MSTSGPRPSNLVLPRAPQKGDVCPCCITCASSLKKISRPPGASSTFTSTHSSPGLCSSMKQKPAPIFPLLSDRIKPTNNLIHLLPTLLLRALQPIVESTPARYLQHEVGTVAQALSSPPRGGLRSGEAWAGIPAFVGWRSGCKSGCTSLSDGSKGGKQCVVVDVLGTEISGNAARLSCPGTPTGRAQRRSRSLIIFTFLYWKLRNVRGSPRSRGHSWFSLGTSANPH